MKLNAGIVGLLAAALAGCAGIPPAEVELQKGDFRLATYNVRCPGDKDENTWYRRMPRVAQVIRDHGISVFGVQEAVLHETKILEWELPNFAHVGCGREADRGGEAMLIFYDRNRFTCHESGTFWLSKTPDVPGSKHPSACCRRTCTWALLEDRVTGKRFRYFNTHLDHVSSQARLDGMRVLLERGVRPAKACGETVILTGDLNETLDKADTPEAVFALKGDALAAAAIDRKSASVWARGVIAGRAAEGLAALGLAPDVIVKPSAAGGGTPALPMSDENDVTWIHRVYEGGVQGYFIACPNETARDVTCSFRVDGYEPEIWDAETGETGLRPRAWKRAGGRTEVTVRLRPSGSAFVLFRKWTESRGAAQAAEPAPRAETVVTGAWRVSFPVEWYSKGTRTTEITMDALADWTTLADPELKYFSGTATYTKRIDLPDDVRAARLVLDLGEVKNLAEVMVNGTAFAPLWRPPYRVDITDAVPAGARMADVTIRVANLWPNRMIGDDRLCAPDCEWTDERNCGLKAVPDFVKEGRPSPTGRHTFATWRHWTKDDALLSSGLLGPVKLVPLARGE